MGTKCCEKNLNLALVTIQILYEKMGTNVFSKVGPASTVTVSCLLQGNLWLDK